jgi:predicted dehydrogenase
MIRFGVIGYGYWGPNIVRNLLGLEGAQLVAICDQNEAALKKVQGAYPGVRATTNSDDILNAADIDVVAVITPVWTHFELAKKALLNGKHVFVEKPFTSTAAQAEELVDIAAQRNLQIMVDHTFLFTGSVRKIRELTDAGELGKIYYYDSTRVNLGLFQSDVDVLWDLAPHDLSIIDYLVGKPSEAVVATGESHFNNGLVDVAYMTIYYPDNVIAHINVNWLSPVKVRMTLIGGEKKMIVWNDLVNDEKIRVYDRGVKVTSPEGVNALKVGYRSGDMWAPKVEATEALKLELGYFVNCINKNEVPMNDGLAGLRVVRMLEAAQESLTKNNEMVLA